MKNNIKINGCMQFVKKDWLLGLILALVSILPILIHHDSINVGWDGVYHLNRFENIAQSFRNGSVPSLFNFLNNANGIPAGVADIAYYPWITGLLFIIPRVFLPNPILAVLIGFFLLNLLTIINVKLLMGEFTNNRLYIWLGVVIYQFNNFHFIDLYSRTAIGESFGYAWFPLVILGIVQIKSHKKVGMWVLGLGMGMLANSHFLTLLMATSFVIIYEFIQMLMRGGVLAHIKQLLGAALISILVSCYSLINIVQFSIHGHIEAPFKALVAIDPSQALQSLLQNDMSEGAIWNHGLPLVVLQIALTVVLFKAESKKNWHSWLIGADILTILLFNWWPWNLLKDTPLASIQFLSRLEIVIVLMLSIALVLFFIKNEKYNMRKIITIEIIICLFSIVGSVNAQKNYNSSHSNLDRQNYTSVLKTSANPDYLPVAKTGDKATTVNSDYDKSINLKQVKRNINQVVFNVSLNSNQKVNVPAVMYSGFKYSIYVDGVKTNSLAKNDVILAMRRGNHTIDIRSENSSNALFLLIAILSMAVVTTRIIMFYRKPNLLSSVF